MYILVAVTALILFIAVLIWRQLTRIPGDAAHMRRGRGIWWLTLVAVLAIEGEAQLDLLDLEGFSWLLYVHILCAVPTFFFLCLGVYSGKEMVRMKHFYLNSIMPSAYDHKRRWHKRFVKYFVVGSIVTLATAGLYLMLAL